MKKKLVILLMILMMICVAIVSYTEAAPVKIKLIAASHVPPSYHDILPLEQAFIDDVNKIGVGRVELDFYHSGTLLGVNELVPGLEIGTADIIFHTTSHTTGSWPVIGGASLPFLYKNAYDLRERFKVGSPLYELVAKTMLDKHEVLILAYGAMPMEYIWTNKPVRTPGDMKGLTIRVGGDAEAKAVKSLGGSPVFMPSGELYEALQRGTVDGVVCYAGTIGGRSLQEVVKYCTKVPIGAYGRGIFIKKSTWDSLPEDVRTLLYVEAIKYDYNHLESAEAVHKNEYWSKKFTEAGMEIIEPPEEVVAEFREKCKPVWSEWANEIGDELGNKFIDLATSK